MSKMSSIQWKRTFIEWTNKKTNYQKESEDLFNSLKSPVWAAFERRSIEYFCISLKRRILFRFLLFNSKHLKPNKNKCFSVLEKRCFEIEFRSKIFFLIFSFKFQPFPIRIAIEIVYKRNSKKRNNTICKGVDRTSHQWDFSFVWFHFRRLFDVCSSHSTHCWHVVKKVFIFIYIFTHHINYPWLIYIQTGHKMNKKKTTK